MSNDISVHHNISKPALKVHIMVDWFVYTESIPKTVQLAVGEILPIRWHGVVRDIHVSVG